MQRGPRLNTLTAFAIYASALPVLSCLSDWALRHRRTIRAFELLPGKPRAVEWLLVVDQHGRPEKEALVVRLPSWGITFDPITGADCWGQWHVLWTSTQGWRLRLLPETP